MTNLDFIKIATDAYTRKTLYVKGGFGAVAGYGDNRERYIDLYSYNTKRAALINAASDDTFFFDCVCFGKGILWGWTGNTKKRYGGAVYKSNGVPDFTAQSVPKHCTDFVENMDGDIQIGEWLVERDKSGTIDHIGYYFGNGKVIEASPRGSDGVQINDLSARAWCGHGKIKYLDYESAPDNGRFVIMLTESYETADDAQKALAATGHAGVVIKIQ